MLCQFLVLAGKRFWFNFGSNTYLLLRAQYSCGGALVFYLQWEIVFDVLHILSVQYSCAVVSVLVLVGNRFWLYILLCTWSTIQLWCCVSFFGSGGK